jgi:phosphopantetheinyl transferase
MPLIFDKKEKDFQLAIWRMDEDAAELLLKGMLTKKDIQQVNTFQSIARKKEWICTRLLLKQLMPQHPSSIIYDENGKPHLENSIAHISVSHTKNFVGVIVSENYPVGIDLELIHPRIEKIAHRFISAEEFKFIPSENKLEHYFVIWGAKESLYKMHGTGELLFKEHLLVMPFQFQKKGEISAFITKGDLKKEYLMNYELIDELLIVYVVDE